MRRSRMLGTLVVLVILWLLITALQGGYRWLTAGPSLENRVWIERIARSPTDRVGAFLVVDQKDRSKLGATLRSSMWQQHADLFTFTRTGDRLTMVFPQFKRRLQVQYRTHACEGPGPLDQCLVLQGANGHRVVLYSSDDLVLPDPTLAGMVMPTVPTALPALTIDEDELTEMTLEELL